MARTPASAPCRANSRVEDFTINPKDKRELATLPLSTISRRLPAERVRGFLLGAVIVEFAVILLIVTNAAALHCHPREGGRQPSNLLLTTPITSRYYIWGKLRGAGQLRPAADRRAGGEHPAVCPVRRLPPTQSQ